MSELESSEVKNIKKVYLAIHKNDTEKAFSSLCRSVTELMGYVQEGIEPEWATHRAEVLYQVYLSFGKSELAIAEDFFNEQKKKVKPLSRAIKYIANKAHLYRCALKYSYSRKEHKTCQQTNLYLTNNNLLLTF